MPLSMAVLCCAVLCCAARTDSEDSEERYEREYNERTALKHIDYKASPKKLPSESASDDPDVPGGSKSYHALGNIALT